MEIVWQIEIDEWCRKILAKHWPGVKRYNDIRLLDPGELARVDLICGGFPCQPASQAGKRKGIEDNRWLWPEFFRIVRQLRPGWILVENVPGLLSVNAGWAFSEVVGDLATLGYDIEWDCISAAAVGAPHRRDRVWIVAHSNGINNQSQIIRKETDRPESDRSSSGSGGSSDVAMANTNNGRRERSGVSNERWQSGAVITRRSKNSEGPRTGTFGQTMEAQSIFRGTIDGISPWLDWTFSLEYSRPTPDSAYPAATGIEDQHKRIRGLGNAVVPQVVEFIGRRIMKIDPVLPAVSEKSI
jgi:DNA (cytosine-5)-methyltransferase 1